MPQFSFWSTFGLYVDLHEPNITSSSVPTKEDILVPETLLKKRKSQEKEREARAADLKKKRDVSLPGSPIFTRVKTIDIW